MDTLLVTVSDDRSGRKGGKYSETQDKVLQLFQACPQFGITRFAFWKWPDILATSFYLNNKKMLDHLDPAINGRCYKPFAILEGLKSLKDGDFLIYNDVSPEHWQKFNSINTNVYDLDVIKGLCIQNGGILSATSSYDTIFHATQENFTLERCINKMGMQAYRHCLQHSSGMMMFQKDKKSMDFVEEWLHWNLDDECASIGSVEEDPAHLQHAYWVAEVYHGIGKLGHRHDQSISGLLLNKMGNRLVDHRIAGGFALLDFCRRGERYQFIDSVRPPLPYRLIYDHINARMTRVPR